MTKELSKRYDASLIEDKWYKHWLEKNYFHSEPNPEKEPYTIVIPPPNVTGILTLGHVLQYYAGHSDSLAKDAGA